MIQQKVEWKTYLESGATHAHICWQNLRNQLITSSHPMNVINTALWPWCWHWLYYWLGLWEVEWSSRAGTAQHGQWSPASTTAGTSKRGLARNRRLQSTAKWARLPIIGTYSCGDWCEIINPFYWQISLPKFRCTSCVWGLLDFHQIFSFQILFFA